MPIRGYKPTSPGRRFMTRSTFEEITTDKPYKPLVESKKRGSGRNSQGRMTVRHRGGGAKRNYRRIDFKRDKWDVPARLATIEYDPNRSARIGLLHYADGEKRYILVPNGLQVGDTVVAGTKAEARVGNALPLKSIPLGTQLHNIELVPGSGGQIVRSAGEPEDGVCQLADDEALGGAEMHARIAGTAAFLAHAFSSVNDSIWKGVSWVITLKFVFDGLVYALLTAGVFAWLWPAAA